MTPDSPSVILQPSGSDKPWTPGQWRKTAESSDESPSEELCAQALLPHQVFTTYNAALEKIASISDSKVEPLTFRLKTEWDKATQNEQRLCVEKVDEACRAVCQVIAPGASEQLLMAYVKSASGSRSQLEVLISTYQQAPTKTLKTQILSIYALRFTVTELKEMHAPFEKLSDRQIKKARSHAKTVGVGFLVEKVPYHRVRIDATKLEHFLTFVDQPYFYQDVSFGTRKVRLDSGQQMIMPNVVRTVCRSTMIKQYQQRCSEEEFEPLSRATLYRILKVREASQRKSLQGLDDTAASGAEGFETLANIVDELERCGASHEWCEGSRNHLRDCKRYLKTSYRAHCRDDCANQCADHCRSHALSDTTNKELHSPCTHAHTQQCDKCDLLTNTLDSILAKIREPGEVQFYSHDQLEDTFYDANQAKEMVLQWKAHILRAENQDRGKTSVVNSLQEDTVFIVMDWAMKFTQIKYREKQSEWFGKRGMNWHVSCVLSKPTNSAGKLEVKSYVHIFNSCAQENPTVLAIIMHLLKKVKATSPQITKAFLRSDGAGCYHGNNLIASLEQSLSHTGIKVMRYV